MKRLPKVLALGAGVLLLLLLAAVVGLNLYVQSPAAQMRIQQQLSDSLGLPLEITSVSVGWSGVRIAGVRIPDGERNLLEANSFSAEYRLWPLLHRKLEIRAMVLDAPKVLWAQNAEGKWVLPVLPKKEHQEDATLPNASGPKQTSTTSSGTFLEVVLDTLEIQNGTIELLDAQQQRIAVATDVSMRYSFARPGVVEGTFSARKFIWKDALTVEELHGPLTFESGVLTLADLSGQVAGGEVRGQVAVQTEAKDSPFDVQLRLTAVDLARLSAEGGWEENQASGSVGGEIALHGTLKKLEKSQGSGKLSITDGQFQKLALFQTVGLILQIPELSDLRVRHGQGEFHVKNEKTYIDQMVLETSDLEFTTKGEVRFDGKLSLEAEVSISPKLVGQLPTFVRSNFNPPDAGGRQSIGFDITGQTDKPKTNLVDRIIGKQVTNQVGDLLSGLFGKPKEPKKEKDKEKEKGKEKKKKEGERVPEAAAPQIPAAEPPAPPPVSPAEPSIPAPTFRTGPATPEQP